MRLTILLILIIFPIRAIAGLIPSEHELFEPNQVQKIRIYFEQEDYWDTLEDNFASETYLEASFEWESYGFETVGVRFKDSSSYQTNPTMKKSLQVIQVRRFYQFMIYQEDLLLNLSITYWKHNNH